jgi:hypothetical protein
MHDLMFDDDDPLLARVRAVALAFPEAQEKVSHGRPAFFTGKVFAYFGGALRVDGEWVQHPQSLVIGSCRARSVAAKTGNLHPGVPGRVRLDRSRLG